MERVGNSLKREEPGSLPSEIQGESTGYERFKEFKMVKSNWKPEV
jgi:hypothetical protein